MFRTLAAVASGCTGYRYLRASISSNWAYEFLGEHVVGCGGSERIKLNVGRDSRWQTRNAAYWSIGVGTTVVAVAFGVRWAALEPPVGRLRPWLVNDAPAGPFPQTGSKQARGQQVPRSGMSRG